MPQNIEKTTHVWVKCPKTTPLGPNFRGPYPIVEKKGKSSLVVKVGVYANGKDRLEMHHWHNMKPAQFAGEAFEHLRPNLGRPTKNSSSDGTSR